MLPSVLLPVICSLCGTAHATSTNPPRGLVQVPCACSCLRRAGDAGLSSGRPVPDQGGSAGPASRHAEGRPPGADLQRAARTTQPVGRWSRGVRSFFRDMHPRGRENGADPAPNRADRTDRRRRPSQNPRSQFPRKAEPGEQKHISRKTERTPPDHPGIAPLAARPTRPTRRRTTRGGKPSAAARARRRGTVPPTARYGMDRSAAEPLHRGVPRTARAGRHGQASEDEARAGKFQQ